MLNHPPPPRLTDYMRDLVLHGLHSYLGPRGGRVTDWPKVQHDYHYPPDQPILTADDLYGWVSRARPHTGRRRRPT
jgi:hypothetical protein